MKSKDKKLLLGLFVFLIVALIFALGIVPTIKDSKKIKENLERIDSEIIGAESTLNSNTKSYNLAKKENEKAKDENKKLKESYTNIMPSYKFNNDSDKTKIIEYVNNLMKKYNFNLINADFNKKSLSGDSIYSINFVYPYQDGKTEKGYFMGYVPVEKPTEGEKLSLYNRIFKENSLGDLEVTDKTFYFKYNEADRFKEEDKVAPNLVGGSDNIFRRLLNDLSNEDNSQIKLINLVIPDEIIPKVDENNSSSSSAENSNTASPQDSYKNIFVTDDISSDIGIKLRPVYYNNSLQINLRVILLQQIDD